MAAWRDVTRVRAAIVLIVGAVVLSLSPTAADAAPATGSISGVVTSSATGAPVAGVRVSAGVTANLTWLGPSAVTDASGAYTITGLSPTSYKVVFRPPADSKLAREYWKSTYDPDRAAAVVVADGASVTGVDAALNPTTASISGHVSVPAGFDPTGVEVRLLEAGQPRYYVYPAIARPAADGSYTISGLPADDYKVYFSDFDGKLTRIYWNGSSTFDGAGIVSIADGQSATGIDAALDTGSSIAGRVTGGQISAGYGRAYVYHSTGDGPPQKADLDRDVPIAADGTFIVTGLAPGAYKLAYQDRQACSSAAIDSDGEPIAGWTSRRFWWNDESGPQAAATISLGDHENLAGLADDLDVTGGERSQPSISGVTVVGQTLQVDAGAWNTGTPLQYRWMAGDQWIPGATSSAFTLTTAQAGRTIAVWVLGRSDSPSVDPCSDEWDQQAATFPTRVMTVATPTISGVAAYGSTLTALPGRWTSGASFTYQWYANGAVISGATKSTYRLTSAQKSKTMTVRVTGKMSGYPTVGESSNPTAKVATATSPKISGTRKVGKKLTASHGTWTSGTKFAYQWYANGVAIKGATKSTYTLKSAQRGEKITVKVIGKKSGYATVSKTSASTATIR